MVNGVNDGPLEPVFPSEVSSPVGGRRGGRNRGRRNNNRGGAANNAELGENEDQNGEGRRRGGGRRGGRGGRGGGAVDINESNARGFQPSRGGGGRGGANNQLNYDFFVRMADHIKGRTEIRPKLAIICGSGLGALASEIQNPEVMEYSTIPAFPRSTVEGHAGELVFGTLSGVPVVAMKGRFHPYEGHTLPRVVVPIRLFKVLGVSTVIVSNAAGGLNDQYKVGDIMMIKDHINFLGFANQSPLKGVNISELGPRFPAISRVYDRDLIKKAREVFTKTSNGDASFLHEGVYTGLGGPTYETIAESRFLRSIGVDAVGMSTTQEVVAAAHCGLRVFGMSLITNKAIMDYDCDDIANHAEVLAAAKAREPTIIAFVREFVESLSAEFVDENDSPLEAKADDTISAEHLPNLAAL
eukprot:GHVH01003887.1.p1 GENE.GHVH01003887.1~~GHVH01003887.1.p1  ORF type:complete len:413 (+),score=54.74 GHVH01003887.1:148-1386(+)